MRTQSRTPDNRETLPIFKCVTEPTSAGNYGMEALSSARWRAAVVPSRATIRTSSLTEQKNASVLNIYPAGASKVRREANFLPPGPSCSSGSPCSPQNTLTVTRLPCRVPAHIVTAALQVPPLERPRHSQVRCLQPQSAGRPEATPLALPGSRWRSRWSPW